MDPYLPAGIISSLIQNDKQSNFIWSNRIENERQANIIKQTHYDQESRHDDKTSGNKKVTWDELVHVRQFEPFSEELKDTYPRQYPYKHSNRRVTTHVQNNQLQNQEIKQFNQDYFTSETVDL